jgi:endonuclease-3
MTREKKAKPAARAPAKAKPAKAKPAKAKDPKPAARAIAPPDPSRVQRILDALAATLPSATTALAWQTPVQLLVATILSAQCTDERVNHVTPVLFATYPDAAALATAPIAEIERIIRTTGFFHNKAKAIKEGCQALVKKHGGELPRSMDALLELPGVARKTANVVLGTAFDLPTGIVVDRHVARVAGRLELSGEIDPLKIERDLMRLVPQERWVRLSHQIVLHGRGVCRARTPLCGQCALAADCPSVRRPEDGQA